MSTQETPLLRAKVRDNSGTGVARQLRRDGDIPAVCYGYDLEAPLNLSVSIDEVTALFDHEMGRNVVFNLEVEGGKKLENVMVKSYQVSPVKRHLLHADFYSVDTEKLVHAKVPLRSKGKPAAMRLGGILNMIRPDIDIKARPADIPAAIEVDVSALKVGQTIQAGDIELPQGVEPGYKANYGLFRVIMPRKKAMLAAEAGEADANA